MAKLRSGLSGWRPFVAEDVDGFSGASSLCPVDGVESEIVAQLRIGPGVEQKGNEMGVIEDRGEDERGLSAAGAFVDVGAVSQQRFHGANVAGSNRLR